MKIAIIGASGNVGQRLVGEAQRRGHHVTAIARKVEGREDAADVRWVAGDIADPSALAETLRGHDATILSVPFRGTDFAAAITAATDSGVARLLVVGGAASLEASPGVALLDTPGFPDFIKPEAEPAREALAMLRREPELDWTFLSPSIMFGPGERTGRFRLGTDAVLTAEDGQSHISYEDYAIALFDEIERPAHRRARFTVGY